MVRGRGNRAQPSPAKPLHELRTAQYESLAQESANTPTVMAERDNHIYEQVGEYNDDTSLLLGDNRGLLGSEEELGRGRSDLGSNFKTRSRDSLTQQAVHGGATKTPQPRIDESEPIYLATFSNIKENNASPAIAK